MDYEQIWLFVENPIRTRNGLFYDPKDKKVFVYTHATFLEMNNFEPRNKVLLEVMSGRSSSAPTRVVRAIEEDLSSSSRSTRVDDAKEEEEENTDLSQIVKLPRCSGRVKRKTQPP